MAGKQVLIWLTMILAGVHAGYGQASYRITGKVTDAETGEPLLYAGIYIKELTLGTTTNQKGEFTLHSIPEGTFTFFVTYIGYAEYTLSQTIKGPAEINIALQKQSLGLEEITVTAENIKGGTTSSRIKSEAIAHLQASSIRDVMQLIPGNLSENPNLANPARISIRETGTDINSALGTAIILDDIPVSNDANMQRSIGNVNTMTSVSGSGIDLRSIPVENIESVTVDVGIPSAEHGNLTSGAVHIKTRTGDSPLNAKFQADPHTKQLYLAKGQNIGENKGVLNLDLGYTQSYAHLVKQTDLFRRINAVAKYTNTFGVKGKPVNLEVKTDMTSTIDGRKWDPDMILQEENYAKEMGFNTKVSANWSVNSPWITHLSADLAYGKIWQNGFEKTWESSSGGPNFFATAETDGEFEISYGPSSYYSEVSYDGKPFQLFAKVKGQLLKTVNRTYNNLIFGTEWRTNGNNGEGRVFNPERPPSGEGTRHRPFTDIPSLHQFSLFAENKMRRDIGRGELNIMTGLRMDNIQPEGLFSTGGSMALDPRINLQYQILNSKNSLFFKDLSFRLGYGRNTKAPTLFHLYPDKDYNDVESFNYYPDLIVYTTKVVADTRNPGLKAARSTKYETGIDFTMGKVSGRITAFFENHTGGFLSERIMFPLYFRDYHTLEANRDPYYVVGDGVYYHDPETGTPVALGYENDVKFAEYTVTRNAGVRIKKGLEYSLDLGTIKTLRTSLNITGAYFFTESWSENAPYWERIYYTVFQDNTSTQESFAVKFSDRYGYGDSDQRLNTSFHLITHIPELRMLVSLNTQVIWFEKDQRILSSVTGELFSLSELRDYLEIPNLFATEDPKDFYYFLPLTYKFYDNEEKTYTREDFREPLHQLAIEKLYKYRFSEQVLPALMKCDIKISKDIGDRLKLSFYANNFLNIRPWHLTSREGTYIRRNQIPWFGADLSVKL